MHNSINGCMQTVRFIICYIQGTRRYGLQRYPSFTILLIDYTNVDQGTCIQDTRQNGQQFYTYIYSTRRHVLQLYPSFTASLIVHVRHVLQLYPS